MQFKTWQELDEICGWECERKHQKRCEDHTRLLDFRVYLEHKKSIIAYYRQIKEHQQVQLFVPANAELIQLMIEDLQKIIKIKREKIKEFHAKYLAVA